MNKRQIQEINAGSMADIAFLLLIFFLVTTTMESDEGIAQQLPQKQKTEAAKTVNRRNVLEVHINANNEMMAEGQSIQVEQLYAITREFFSNPLQKEEMPEMMFIDEGICRKHIAEAGSYTERKAEEERWHLKLKLAIQLGSVRLLPDDAVISIQNDNGTSYAAYIRAQNEIHQAIQAMRNEWSMKLFGIKFSELKENKKEDQEKIQMIRLLVPQRLIEQEPKNISLH